MYAVKWWSVKDNKPKPYADSWADFVALLSKHAEREDKYKGHLYSPVTYVENGYRGNKNVIAINAFVADLDGESLNNTLDKLQGFEYIAYTTHSHKEDDQHWHIVIPFDEAVPSHQWYSVWKQMHTFLEIVGDPQTCDPARIFFAPQHAPNSDFHTIRGNGEIMQAPEFRYTDRPPVTITKRENNKPELDYWACTCTLSKRCKKCEIEFKDLDLSRYNGMSQKEIRHDIRREFLELMAGVSAT
jgi:hypothetical protein